VLITFGAVLGKTTPLQLLLVAIIETILAQLNEHIGLHHLHVRHFNMYAISFEQFVFIADKGLTMREIEIITVKLLYSHRIALLLHLSK
jgi:hypothetical protein